MNEEDAALIARLRKRWALISNELAVEAADRIEALSTTLAQIRNYNDGTLSDSNIEAILDGE